MHNVYELKCYCRDAHWASDSVILHIIREDSLTRETKFISQNNFHTINHVYGRPMVVHTNWLGFVVDFYIKSIYSTNNYSLFIIRYSLFISSDCFLTIPLFINTVLYQSELPCAPYHDRGKVLRHFQSRQVYRLRKIQAFLLWYHH